MYRSKTTTKRTMGSIEKNTRSGRPRESRIPLSALLLLVAIAGTACGGEVRSESDIPAGGDAVEALSAPALTERVEQDAEPDESRWGPAAYVAQATGAAEASEPESVPVESTTVTVIPEPEPKRRPEPRREEPILVATDTGEGQVVDFEPSTDVSDPDNSEFLLAEEEADLLQIQSGAELAFTMETEVSTQNNRPGDVFYAYLTDDFVAADGMVLLPRGVRARGRVVETVTSGDSEDVPVLEVVLEQLIGPGQDTPILATVLGAELEADPRDSDGESVVKVLTGAAAGAILGRILGGGGDDAVKGGLAGAAAGAAVAYGTRGGHAKLPAGAQLTIRLDQPLTVF